MIVEHKHFSMICSQLSWNKCYSNVVSNTTLLAPYISWHWWYILHWRLSCNIIWSCHYLDTLSLLDYEMLGLSMEGSDISQLFSAYPMWKMLSMYEIIKYLLYLYICKLHLLSEYLRNLISALLLFNCIFYVFMCVFCMCKC